MRLNVVDLAAQVLGSMPAATIPPQLRGIAKFDPRKRAKLGSAPIAAQLENDKEFREVVAESVAAGWPELVASLVEGNVPPAADPVLVAAAAYLTRPVGWAEMVEAARADLEQSAVAAEGTEREEAVNRLREQLAAQKSAAKEESDRLREQLRLARAENSDLRRKLHDARERSKAAVRRAEEMEHAADDAKSAASAAGNAGESELRRLRERLADVEKQLEA
ncbi:MAG TPA: RNA-binding protein, partial [Nonomuraea sp.]|nr:RNA-binding protein [Nonomuraea sp.]